MFTNSFKRKGAAMLLATSLVTLGTIYVSRADDNAGGNNNPPAVSAPNIAQITNQFAGPKANRGTATLRHQNGVRTLTWSDDFKIPDTPAPHWQVVDSSGNTYLLQRLVIKGDKQNRTVSIPSYVKDVAKVQIWCAYAEVVLGEASFASPVN